MNTIRTTILSHTFKRPQAWQRLLESIAKYYPDYVPDYVIINDDSEYDRGVSWGRNFLATQAKTEYVIFVDDDFIFTEKTDIKKLEKIMDTTDNDLLGFECNCGYMGMFVIEDEGETVNLVRRKNEQGKYDIIPQIFIARREVMLKHKWDETIKIGEHFAFFYEHYKSLKIDFTHDVAIAHSHIGNPDYSKHRARAWDYVKAHMRRKGIKKLNEFGSITIA